MFCNELINYAVRIVANGHEQSQTVTHSGKMVKNSGKESRIVANSHG